MESSTADMNLEELDALVANYDFDMLAVAYIKDMVSNLQKYIDKDLKVKGIEEFENISRECGVDQVLMGDQMLYTGLFASADVMLYIASAFGQEEFKHIDADSLDAISEFLNMCNGIYVSARSDEGIELDLDPPMMYPASQNLVADDGVAYNLIIDLNGHELSVLFSVDIDVFVE